MKAKRESLAFYCAPQAEGRLIAAFRTGRCPAGLERVRTRHGIIHLADCMLEVICLKSFTQLAQDGQIPGRRNGHIAHGLRQCLGLLFGKLSHDPLQILVPVFSRSKGHLSGHLSGRNMSQSNALLPNCRKANPQCAEMLRNPPKRGSILSDCARQRSAVSRSVGMACKNPPRAETAA